MNAAKDIIAQKVLQAVSHTRAMQALTTIKLVLLHGSSVLTALRVAIAHKHQSYPQIAQLAPLGMLPP